MLGKRMTSAQKALIKPVTLTERQIAALSRAWEVLASGVLEQIPAGSLDLVKRPRAFDRNQARVIDELLEKAGIDADWYDA
jgi:hypothetical protein